MSEIYFGNAAEDGGDRRGWILGSFIPEGIRHQDDLEIKYGVHKAGESRTEWVTGETRTTLCMLLTGKSCVEFPEKIVELNEPGDYVIWGAGFDHKWGAIKDSTILTIRWSE